MDSNDSKRRKICPHCTESISYSAYLAHKARYYDTETSQWITGTANDVDAEGHDRIVQSDTEDCSARNEEVSFESDSSYADNLETEDGVQDYDTLEVI